MKTKYTVTAFFLLLLCVCVGCDNDDYATGAEPPILGELTLNSYEVQHDEEIEGRVSYEYVGKDVIKMEYSIIAIKPGGESFKLKDGELFGEDLKNIFFRFNAPSEPNSYRIRFNVTSVSVSTGNARGGVYVDNPASPPAKVLKVL